MRIIFALGLFTSIGMLASTFAADQKWAWMVVIVAFGLLWFLESARSNLWASHLGLVFYAGMSFYGLFLGFEPMVMLLGLISALIAWDLDHFFQRVGQSEEAGLMLKIHLARLGVVAIIAIVLGLFALNLELRFNFWWVALIVLLGVVAISRAFIVFQQESD